MNPDTNRISTFSIQNTEKPTNQDLAVIFTPTQYASKYEYIVTKDNQVGTPVVVTGAKPSTIYLLESGNYQITVNSYDARGALLETKKSGIYQIDKDKPRINVGEKSIVMEKGSTLKPLEGIRVTDLQDGDLLSKVKTNFDELDFETLGVKKLTYTVTDSAGNTASESITIRVVESTSNQLQLTQIGIIVVLFSVIFLIVQYRKVLALEKRIGKYALEPLVDNSKSLFDKLLDKYFLVVKRFANTLKKSVFVTNYARKYDKYAGTVNKRYKEGMHFISSKLLISFFFVLVAVFAKTLQYQVLTFYELMVPLLFGFMMPDILYIYQYKRYRNQIENDLLQAIIIMNNAFKSGRSITQAIHLVTEELTGPICEEFKKMSLEISFGLSIDMVFKRFSERIQLEEVTYLTASLSILNKTGGNIIKVFASIEESLFSKKKLKLEMSSLTGSSRLIVYALIAVPILFIAFVSLINPTYFLPFFQSPIGVVLMVFMILLYLIYIYFVRKIMKVRM
ncbi:MAG: type II secretion system F family protein [Firmicutes bacterium]|nr:type II secretion system F family protein [Bacillota bacterium]